MENEFQIAAGSIPGREHVGRGRLLTGRNNQDAFGHRVQGAGLVAVVCDGCGSGRNSELGAQLGARLIPSRLGSQVSWLAMESDPDVWQWSVEAALERVRISCTSWLGSLARGLSQEPEAFVRDHFLFTVVGAVVTKAFSAVFSIGDGVWGLNGRMEILGPFPGNAPPYLGYSLLPGLGEPGFRVNAVVPTAKVESLVIGSDGVADLMAAADRRLPGRDEILGPLDQFWQVEQFYSNPDAIRRRLALANSQAISPEKFTLGGGLLPDDTTLVVIRRTPAEEVSP